MLFNNNVEKNYSVNARQYSQSPKSEKLSEAGLEFHYVKRALAVASAIVYTDWILIRRQEYRLFLFFFTRPLDVAKNLF